MLRALLAALFLSLLGCAEPTSQSQDFLDSIEGRTMGTGYSIRWVDALDQIDASAIQVQVDQALQLVNQQMSTYQSDSELSLFNQSSAPSKMAVSPALAGIIQQSIDLNQLTSGYFDVSIGPLVNLWGFGPDEMTYKAPSDDAISQAKNTIGLDAIQVSENTITKSEQRYIDLSAIAKGYGVDVVAQTLEQAGINQYLVEIGGEIRTKGTKVGNQSWVIAVEKPDQSGRSAQKILKMTDIGLATSGDYRNYFEQDGVRFSHTIDPQTGKPVTHKLASVTVLDPLCARADALATAMLVMGEKKAMEFAMQHSIPAYMIVREGEGFKEMLSPAFIAWQEQGSTDK